LSDISTARQKEENELDSLKIAHDERNKYAMAEKRKRDEEKTKEDAKVGLLVCIIEDV
jgi:hypothetical protein